MPSEHSKSVCHLSHLDFGKFSKLQPEGLAEQTLEADSLLTYILVLLVVGKAMPISKELNYGSQAFELSGLSTFQVSHAR